MSSPVSNFTLVARFLPPEETMAINQNALRQTVELPGSEGLITMETATLFFPSVSELRKALTQPIPIEAEVIEKVIKKLTPIIGASIYPSQLARLIFELAYTDVSTDSLTPQESKDNVSHILCNLGREYPNVVEKLYAFYYGFSADYFKETEKK